MREFILRHKVGAATIVGALVVAAFSIALVIYAARDVHANAPPLGDCFGGVLSKDPIHCYVLEQAEQRGVISVEAIYDVVGTYLYVFLRQDGPIGDGVGRFFREKSHEFADRWRDRVAEPPAYEYEWCREVPIRIWAGVPVGGERDCLVDSSTRWSGDTLLSYSANYKNILVRAGGSEARHSEPADMRRAMRKVWPSTASGASGASSGSPTTFDVSDVDMTNLPVNACPEVLHGDKVDVCSRDQDVALSIVGRYEGYFQIKDPPTDEAGLAALKEILVPCYNRHGSCTYMATTTVTSIVDGVETHTATRTEVHFNSAGSGKIAIIPVKYGPGELARWTEILDRFATSPGNTIGILGAAVGDNRPLGESNFWPLDTLGPADRVSDIRTTIELSAHNGQLVVDSLPILLPLLGIPTDAVGVVREWTVVATGARYGGPSLEGLWRSEYPQSAYEWTALERFAGMFGVSVRVLIGSTGVGAVLVAGGIVALVLRLRRRRAPG